MEAGLAEELLDDLNRPQRVLARQQKRDALFLGPAQDRGAWGQVAGEDDTGGGRLQGGELNVGPVASCDDRLVGLAAEVGQGMVCSHGPDHEAVHQLLPPLWGVQDLGPKMIRQLADADGL